MFMGGLFMNKKIIAGALALTLTADLLLCPFRKAVSCLTQTALKQAQLLFRGIMSMNVLATAL